MRFEFKTAIAALLALFLFAAVGSGQLTAPGLNWHSMETPHFSIIYHDGNEGMAQLTAIEAEAAYDWWGEKLQYWPADKIYLVVADVQDGPNGFANIKPFNSIVNFTAFGGFASGFSNSQNKSWEQIVTWHEYAHIIDLDFVSGLSQTLRSIFGRVVTPAVAEPTLLVEGIADHAEFLERGYSRSNEPRVASMLRAMILENNFPDYQKASFYYNRSEWPFPGSISHDMGPWFVRFLEETYGADVYANIKKTQTEHPIWALGSLFAPVPFAAVSGDFNTIYKKVTGKGIEELWVDFKAWLRVQFNEQIQDIEAKGITPSRRLTQFGWNSSNSTWSPDGQWVYYTLGGSPNHFGGIRRVHSDGTGDEAVASGGFPDFVVTPDGKALIYAKTGIYDKAYAWRDLYRFDLETGAETRLTWGERPFQVAVTPDGNSVIYARYNWGQKTPSISRYDLRTGEITAVQDFGDDYAVEGMTLSPDGRTLALSIYRRGGYSDIYTLPVTGGQLTAVTQDKATDFGPNFSPDGQYLFFSSDRTDVYNLYAFNLAAGTLHQVTNVLTGAQAPAISPAGDSQIAFTSYSSRGYDVHVLRYEPNTWREVTFTKETIPAWDGFPTSSYEIKPYNPIPSLLPKLWQPQFGEGTVGLSTFGQDAIYEQFYGLSAGWDFNASSPYFNFNYAHNGLRPSVALFGGVSGAGYYAGANLAYPLIAGINHNQNINVGYQRSDYGGLSQTFSAAWSINDTGGLDVLGQTTNFRLTGLYTLAAEAAPITKGIARLIHSHVFSADHSLNLRLVAGWSDAETAEQGFRVGGLEGQFMVRGIAGGAATGQKALAGSLEFRFPIATIEKGISLWPIFIDDLTGDVFVDIGYAGLEPTPKYFEDLKIGYGAEAQLSLNLLSYFGGPVIRFGIAQGLGATSPSLYISGGTAF